MTPQRLKILARRMTDAATKLKRVKGWHKANTITCRWAVWASQRLTDMTNPKREVNDGSGTTRP